MGKSQSRSVPTVCATPSQSERTVPRATTCGVVVAATFGEDGAAELINLVGLYRLLSVTLNGFDVPVLEIL